MIPFIKCLLFGHQLDENRQREVRRRSYHVESDGNEMASSHYRIFNYCTRCNKYQRNKKFEKVERFYKIDGKHYAKTTIDAIG